MSRPMILVGCWPRRSGMTARPKRSFAIQPKVAARPPHRVTNDPASITASSHRCSSTRWGQRSRRAARARPYGHPGLFSFGSTRFCTCASRSVESGCDGVTAVISQDDSGVTGDDNVTTEFCNESNAVTPLHLDFGFPTSSFKPLLMTAASSRLRRSIIGRPTCCRPPAPSGSRRRRASACRRPARIG